MHFQELSQAQEEDLFDSGDISLSSLAICHEKVLNMTTEDCAGGNLTDVTSMVRNTHMSAVESVNHFLASYTESLYNSRGRGSFWCHSHAYCLLNPVETHVNGARSVSTDE